MVRMKNKVAKVRTEAIVVPRRALLKKNASPRAAIE
jgi:hypothetical protein